MRNPVIYTIFLSVATVTEVFHAFGSLTTWMTILYGSMLFWLVFTSDRPEWIWMKGIIVIGYIALVSLAFQAFDSYTPTVRMIDCFSCAFIYMIAMVKMQRWFNQAKNGSRN
jgi:uncharacterized membrane protein SirB2